MMRGSMVRSRQRGPGTATSRPGVLLPAVLAAFVCGGSVLAIAVTGTVALDGGGPVAIRIPSGPSAGAAGPSGPGRPAQVPGPGAAATTSQVGIGDDGRPRDRPATAVRVRVPLAPTARDHTIAVRGGEFDGPQARVGRGSLASPQVVAAAPTVVLLDPSATPLPAPSGTPTPSGPPTPTPSGTPAPSGTP